MNLNLNVSTTRLERQEIRLKKVILEKQKSGELRKPEFYSKHLNKFYDISCSRDEMKSQMTDIIHTLNRRFEDKWEIFLDVIVVEGSLKLEIYVVIHYPSIEITNEDGDSKEIQDLLVSFKIFSNKFSNHLTVGEPQGCRATLSYEDWICRYHHSHLPMRTTESYSDCFYNQYFCIGDSTELNGYLLSMWDEDYVFSDIIFESYLYLLDSLLEHESLSGVPYIKMREVKIASNNNYIPNRYSEIFIRDSYKTIEPYLISEDTIKNIDFALSNGRYIVKPNSNFEDAIQQVVCLTDLKSDLLYIESDGVYKSYSKVMILPEENLKEKFEGVNGQPSIFIQGKELEFKVLPYTGEITPVDKFNVHPQFLKYAKERIEEKLYINCIRKSTVEKYHQSSSTR